MNPLSTHEKLVLDESLLLEFISPNLRVNQQHKLIIHCSHQNTTEMCAKSYRIWFVGPTLVSPTFDAARILDDRRVEITFSIRDPGVYELYAWPEHERCDQWNTGSAQCT